MSAEVERDEKGPVGVAVVGCLTPFLAVAFLVFATWSEGGYDPQPPPGVPLRLAFAESDLVCAVTVLSGESGRVRVRVDEVIFGESPAPEFDISFQTYVSSSGMTLRDTFKVDARLLALLRHTPSGLREAVEGNGLEWVGHPESPAWVNERYALDVEAARELAPIARLADDQRRVAEVEWLVRWTQRGGGQASWDISSSSPFARHREGVPERDIVAECDAAQIDRLLGVLEEPRDHDQWPDRLALAMREVPGPRLDVVVHDRLATIFEEDFPGGVFLGRAYTVSNLMETAMARFMGPSAAKQRLAELAERFEDAFRDHSDREQTLRCRNLVREFLAELDAASRVATLEAEPR